MTVTRDWQNVIDHFRPVTLTDGPWEVTFDFWEDGLKGPFYDPDDPKDEPLLRLTVHHEDDYDWQRVVSYVTRYRVDEDRAELMERLTRLARLVQAVPHYWGYHFGRWDIVLKDRKEEPPWQSQVTRSGC